MAIYANNVAMLTLKDTMIGFIIENKSFADSMRQIFHLIWEAY